MTEKKELTDI